MGTVRRRRAAAANADAVGMRQLDLVHQQMDCQSRTSRKLAGLGGILVECAVSPATKLDAPQQMDRQSRTSHALAFWEFFFVSSASCLQHPAPVSAASIFSFPVHLTSAPLR